jgi:hypothetical protein
MKGQSDGASDGRGSVVHDDYGRRRVAVIIVGTNNVNWLEGCLQTLLQVVSREVV